MDHLARQSQRRFLLFVDQAPILLSLKRELRKRGLVVLECRDVAEARRLIREFHFDLIFIDLLVPGEPSGYDLCKELKGEDRTKEIPFFLFCDHPLPAQVTLDYFLELKAERFIAPPFDPALLADRIRAIL